MTPCGVLVSEAVGSGGRGVSVTAVAFTSGVMDAHLLLQERQCGQSSSIDIHLSG